MDVRREARQQVIQRVVDGARGDDVIIVEDEVDGAFAASSALSSAVMRPRIVGGCVARSSAGVAPVRSGIGAIERGDRIGPEADWVVVVLVESDPRDGPPLPRQPGAQEGRLAGARRRGKKRDLPLQGVFETLNQAWALDEMGARRRRGQLRAQQITECAI